MHLLKQLVTDPHQCRDTQATGEDRGVGGEPTGGKGKPEQEFPWHTHEIRGAEIMGHYDRRRAQALTEGLFAGEDTLHLAGHITEIDRPSTEILIAELLEQFGLDLGGTHDRLGSGQFFRADERFSLLLECRVGQEHTVSGKDLSLIETVGLGEYLLVMRNGSISLLYGLSETS
jgi:hypothetical protein